MKIRCLVVDDEKLAQEVLVHHISKFDILQLEGICNNAFELISFLNKNKEIDLIFLDIKMPEMSGTDFVNMSLNLPAIIYTTAYSSYAVDAYSQNAIDYLMKPISLERFSKSIHKISQLLKPAPQTTSIVPEDNGNYFYVKSNKRLVKIELAELMYIEGMRNYVCFYTETEKIVVHGTLITIEENLKHLHYVCRVHKSYFINLNKISYVEQHMVILTNKKSIPIGLNYRNQIYEKIRIL